VEELVTGEERSRKRNGVQSPFLRINRYKFKTTKPSKGMKNMEIMCFILRTSEFFIKFGSNPKKTSHV
jgi:hypothetical protein